jgi:hypothetical protein
MVYSKAYAVTPQRNEILIPKGASYNEASKCIGVRVVNSADTTKISTDFEMSTTLFDAYGYGL